MSYTLFVFKVAPENLESQHLLAALERLLDGTAKHRADIFLGSYVFETQKGWLDMHRLRTALTEKKVPFLELQFEAALSGFFPPSIRDKLKAIGINDDALFNLSE